MVVVGAGIVGAGTAAELARGGRRVVVLDRGHPTSRIATTLSGGMVRAYDPDPKIRAWAAESLHTYLDPSRWPSGESEVRAVGSVTMPSTGDEPDPAAAAADLVAAGFRDTHVRDSNALGVALAGAGAVVEPSAGYVEPADVAAQWLTRVRENGGEVHHGLTVTELLTGPGAATVRTDQVSVEAGNVVVATGAWQPPPSSPKAGGCWSRDGGRGRSR
ncbi:NAD(P)/FAD-dependent oxidoreductase [Couchioplanes caeruleus]|uniref:FAD dependent oxidoreductase domain-containing protein n=1 Tax=Couchioplanes caeruleus subsp. caeruleus TaxID=56427 RepID=A0A1K0GU97_9ACTN|nr:FAD-dependent oxidoreductase [Couchioplanes caeruleus]OJF14868.1 hypothetical protein BG844_07550 [Couchioplanes caeruleus subsp. caeruleus]